MRADARSASFLTGSQTMLAVQFRTAGSRTMLAGGVPPLQRLGGASRTEPPLRIAAVPSRFSFASSSTYRKGSPRYRRAFSVFMGDFLRRLAVPFRRTGSRTMLAAQPRMTGLGTMLAVQLCAAGTRTMLAGECPLFGAGAP